MRKVILSGMIGNGLEWYDFALYGQMAALIGAQFFPQSDPAAQLLASYGAFAAGFLARPFGGILFGWIGDRLGRRRALSLSVLLMAAATGAIGLMPTHAHIGLFAPLLLVLVRVLQGLSIGGEFSGAIAYMVEHAPPEKRGIIGSMAMASLVIGFLTGSLVATGFSWAMSAEAFESWGWRVPFIMGIGIGLVGFYIRSHCEESPVYERARKEGTLSSAPVREAFTLHWLPLLRAIGVYFLVTMPFYMVSIYFITFNKQQLGMPFTSALALNTAGMAIMLLAVPLSALLSDRMGRKKVLLGVALGFLLISYPLFSLFTPEALTWVVGAQLVFAVWVGLMIGPVPAFLAELFPTRVRTTGMAIAYNIAAAAFGGTAPIVSLWLITTFHSTAALAYYIMLAAVCGMLALLGYRDRYKDALI